MDKFIARAPVTVLGKDYRSGDSFEADAAEVGGMVESSLVEAVGVLGRAAPSTPAAPTDPAKRQSAIIAAIATLDANDGDLWLRDGRPDASVLADLLGWSVSAAERNAAWAAMQPAP